MDRGSPTDRSALQCHGWLAFVVVASIALGALLPSPEAVAAGPTYTYLRSDDLPTTITGSRTVNVVFIGVEPGSGPQQIHPDFLSRLQSSFAIASGTNFGAFDERVYNGQLLRRTVDYNIVFAPPAYQNYFFARLLNMALGNEGLDRGFPQLNVATTRPGPAIHSSVGPPMRVPASWATWTTAAGSVSSSRTRWRSI